MSNNLTITRVIEAQQIVVRSECPPAAVTVLNDENGGEMPAYLGFFNGQKSDAKIRLELGAQDFSLQSMARIGFQEKLPDDIGPRDFLLRAGFSAERVESIINEFELKKVSYLTCAQLSATAGRQLLLLLALESKAKVLVLNDPFLPFSGRWRESFAERLLKDVKEKGRIVVIFNLSFVPSCWAGKSEIKTSDLGKITDQALQKALAAKAREAAKQTGESVKQAEKKKEEPAIAASNDKKENIKIPVPEFAFFAYKNTRDFIFEPLANYTRVLRKGGIAVFGIGTALVAVLLAVMMAPDLFLNIKLIRELAAKYNPSLKEVVESVKIPEQKKLVTAPEGLPSATPTSTDAVVEGLVADVPTENAEGSQENELSVEVAREAEIEEHAESTQIIFLSTAEAPMTQAGLLSEYDVESYLLALDSEKARENSLLDKLASMPTDQ